jgi:hypothetical protein
MPRQGRAGHPFITVLVCAILFAFAGRAGAEPSPGKSPGKVLLVVDRQNDPFLARVRDEVTSLGFMVVAKSKGTTLEADAREEQAIAAIRILPSRKGVEVWMADTVSGRSLLRQVIVDERPEGPDQGLIALQTAELLRTGLLAPQTTEKKPVPSPPVVFPPVPPSPSSETAGQAGLGFLYSPGGVAVAPMVLASLSQISTRGFGLSLDLGVAYRDAAISDLEGKSRVLAFHVGAAGLWRIRPQGSAWSLTSGIGLALARVSARGDSTLPGLLEQSSSVFEGMGYGRVFLGRAMTRWLTLGVGAMAGATFQRVVFRFAGFEVARFGLPLLSLSVMAEIHYRDQGSRRTSSIQMSNCRSGKMMKPTS